MILLRPFRELIEPNPWFSAISALMCVVGTSLLLLDLGNYVFAEYVWIGLLIATSLRWVSATRVRLVSTAVPWSEDASRLERRTVLAAAVLFITTSALTTFAVLLSGWALRFGLAELAATVTAIALCSALFAWFRAPIPWRLDQSR
jgi:hypothetical protein